MNKKIILLAFAAISAAAFALPAAASANPALHINGTPTFTISGGSFTLTRADNNNITCTSSTGSGSFVTTTTGKVTTTLHGCKSTALGIHCSGTGQPTGTVVSTEQEFHLVTKLGGFFTAFQKTFPGNHLISMNCAGLPVTVSGAGVMGSITSPACGASSTTMGVSFNSASAGTQDVTSFTGTTYDATSNIAGSAATTSIDTTATITFAGSQTLTCT